MLAQVKSIVARSPWIWTLVAWCWLDLPTFAWWGGFASLRQLWHSPMGFISPRPGPDHLLAAGWYGVGVAILVLAYPWLAESRPQTGLIGRWIVPAAALVLATVSFPVVSRDMFAYYGEWRLLTIYHQNPMLTPVDLVPHWRSDPWLVMAGWQRTVNPYGPAWFLLLAALGKVLPLNFLGFFVLWKAMALLITGVTGYLVNRIRPGQGLRYLMHPVVAIEFLVNGHNDLLMVGLGILAYFLWTHKLWVWAGLAAGLSVATKYISVLALAWLTLINRGWRSRLVMACTATAAGLATLAPFWHGIATLLGPEAAAHLFLRSPAFVVQGMLVHLTGMPRLESRHWAFLGASGLFLMLYGWTSIRFIYTRDPVYLGDALLEAALVLMSWLQFWYVSWSLPFYVMSRSVRAHRMVYFLAYLEWVRVVGWPLGLPAVMQVVQLLFIWLGLGWALARKDGRRRLWGPELRGTER